MSRVRPSFSQAFLNRLRSWSRLSFIRTLTRIKHAPRFSSPDTVAIISRVARGGNRFLAFIASGMTDGGIRAASSCLSFYIREQAGQGLNRELYFVTDNPTPGEDRPAFQEREGV